MKKKSKHLIQIVSVVQFVIIISFYCFSINATASKGLNKGAEDVYYVGTGQNYTSFTRDEAAGFFKFLNTSFNGSNGKIDRNITVYVTSDITNETGAIQLGSLIYDTGGPYTITITTDAATLRTVSGGPLVSGEGLITFNGSSYITVDGSFNASGKYLTFTSSSFYVVYTILGFKNDANHITVKNCTLSGTAIGDDIGSIKIGSAITTGNCFITIDNNDIGNDSYINTRIYCNGTSSAPNHDITITNNNIFNFLDGGNSMYDYGINVTSTGNGSNWIITGNSFYQTGVQSYGAYHMSAISFQPGAASTNNLISGNYIGGNSPQCQANTNPGYWGQSNNNNSAQESDIININCGNIIISNNVIKNIRFTGSNQNLILLNIAGSTTTIVDGNKFGDASYQVSNTSAYISAIIYKGSGSDCQFINNIIKNIKCTGGSTDSYGIYINLTGPMTNLLIQGNNIEIPRSTTINYNSGIKLNGSYNITGSVLNNRIYDNTNVNGGSNYGIYLSVPGIYAICSLTVANNQIALRNASALFGIYETCYNGKGSSINYFYNTVYITGIASSTYNSCAFFNGNSGGSYPGPARSIKNNVFINSRTGGGTQTTISNRYGDPAWLSSTSDYNLLLNASVSNIGNWNGTNKTFAQWQAASGGDTHSISPTYNASTSTYTSNNLCPNNLFIAPNTADLHIKTTDLQSYQFVSNLGIDLSSIGLITDYDNETRCPNSACAGGDSAPDIGSDEFSSGASCTAVAITTNPVSPSILCDANGIATMTVKVSGTANFNYQWQVYDAYWSDLSNGGIYGTSAVSSNSSSATNTLSITNPDISFNNNQYRCIINNCSGLNSVTSLAASLTIDTIPKVITNPGDMTISSGKSVSFSISTIGAGLSFQWQENGIDIIDGATNPSYSGANTKNLTISGVLISMDQYEYRCIINSTSPCNNTPLTSNAATLTITDCCPPKLNISGNVVYDNTLQSAMNNTKVYLLNENDIPLDTVNTNEEGYFIINNVQKGIYKLKFSTVNQWGGSNPLDALFVNRTFIGTYTPANKLYAKAADVKDDGTIDPLDALFINRRYIGFIDSFTANDWIFEEPVITVDNQDVVVIIKCLCSGDINGSYPSKK